MSSIAIISDVHANLSALMAVFIDIHQQECKRIFCLGDLVGYYTQPIPVIHLIMNKCKIVIKGNHDQAAALGDVPVHFREDSLAPLDWTNHNLTLRERRILHDLPIMHTERDIKNKRTLLFIHGGPEFPLDQYIFPDNESDIQSTFEFLELVNINTLFLGHTHIPFKREWNDYTIYNPGSVGQPRDGNSKASYLIYDPETNDAEFRRVNYDQKPTIDGIKKFHFANDLADRLLVGK